MITFKFGLERPEGCDCPNYSAFAISSCACNLLGYLDELPCLKDVTESFHIQLCKPGRHWNFGRGTELNSKLHDVNGTEGVGT